MRRQQVVQVTVNKKVQALLACAFWMIGFLEYSPLMAVSVDYQQVNQEAGAEIWQDESLWDDSIKRLAMTLKCMPESNANGKVTYRGMQSKLFGVTAESVLLAGENGQLTQCVMTFTNKGDSVPSQPDKEDFDSTSEFKKAQRVYRDAIKGLDRKIRAEADTLEAVMEKLFGEAEKGVVGQSSAVRERVKTWKWKGHQFLMAEQKGEYLSLKILPEGAETTSLSKEVDRDEFYEIIQKRIVRRKNGDVVISQIPMVDQGGKGYCVPATWSRYLRYMGVEGVDQHQLAKAGGTSAGGGTNSKQMVNGVKKLATRNRLQVDDVGGKMSIRKVASYIDKGLPLMWSMRCVGPFRKPVPPGDRMGDMSAEQWEASLEERRKNAEELAKIDSGYHMCMIIGYNDETQEIATSDSWGPGHAEKWFPVEEVEAVFRGSWYVIKR